MAKVINTGGPPAGSYTRGRQYVTNVAPPVVMPATNGKLVSRGIGKSVQVQPKGTKKNVQENMGSQLRIVPNMHCQSSQEAQYTQRNGKLLPPATVRSGFEEQSRY